MGIFVDFMKKLFRKIKIQFFSSVWVISVMQMNNTNRVARTDTIPRVSIWYQ